MRPQMPCIGRRTALAALALSGCVPAYVPAPPDGGDATEGSAMDAAPSNASFDGSRETGGDSTIAIVDAAAAQDAPVDTATSHDALADTAAATSPDAPVDTASLDATADTSPEGEAGPTCTNACTQGLTECAGGGVQTCELQSGGCTQWVTTATCNAHQTCTVTAGVAACTCASTVCAQAGTACETSQTLVSCVADAEGCLYIGSSSTCSGTESCSGTAPNAACSATCSSSCAAGQTACVSGELATCTLGANGCYAYGVPAPCPGSRESCIGNAGSASCTCNVDPVCASVAPTCASTSLLASCAQDSQGCFYEASSMNCTNGACSAGACCTNACANGTARCTSDGVETCAVQANGCTAWSTATACPQSTPYCEGAGVCGACMDGATQCSFNGVQTCAGGAWGAPVACPVAMPNCSAGACGEPPSCATSGAGTTNCGTASETCCASPAVPAGSFDRTYTNNGGGAYGQADLASVSAFRVDKYQVTVGRFRQYVNYLTGGGTAPANGSGKHAHLNGGQGLTSSNSPGNFEPGWIASQWGTDIPTGAGAVATWNSNLTTSCGAYAAWTAAPASQENLPINCTTWYEAYAFCIWDGGFFPSEAEWEYTAAGGTQLRQFPWGSTEPGTTNQYAIYGCNYPSGSGTCTSVANIAPVGTATLGVGLWGQLDLGGDMNEWTLDSFAAFIDPCTDCANLTAGSYQAIRGGAYELISAYLQAEARLQNLPTNRTTDVGFRCARSP
jgi:sulfatase modifying factor 1